VLLPLAARAIVVTQLLRPGVTIPGAPAAMVGLVVGAVIQTVVTTMSVVIVLRLFEAFANRGSRTP